MYLPPMTGTEAFHIYQVLQQLWGMLMLMEASPLFSLDLPIPFPFPRPPYLIPQQKTLHGKPTSTTKSFFLSLFFLFLRGWYKQYLNENCRTLTPSANGTVPRRRRSLSYSPMSGGREICSSPIFPPGPPSPFFFQTNTYPSP